METDQLKEIVLPTEIKIGGLVKEDLIKRVLAAGFKIEQNTLTFIKQNNFPCTYKKKTLRLVYKTTVEMGLGEEPTYKEVKEWIIKNGSLCDIDTALWISLEYANQSLVEWIAVMSNPLPEKYDNDPCTLHLTNLKESQCNQISYCYFRPHHQMKNKLFCYLEK
ncbi:MAG: hypothetical protein ACI9AR_000287 [Flavobacteriaceae bacterium]|jgi:hypothetical protein